MEQIRVKDVVSAVNGHLLMGDEKQPIEQISLDSRNMKENDLFVPIVGERVDAHRFLVQALENGAVATFTSREKTAQEVESLLADCAPDAKARRASWIAVDDTRAALQRLGAFCRSRLQIPLIGVTGSVGKTTTREMIAAALGGGFSNVYRTPGNSNSQVGVPITLSSIPFTAQIAVVELGISEFGEMERIAQLARVDAAVVTNIGIAHIGQLGSQENIRAEKLCIQHGMNPNGTLFLNGDDPLLCNIHAEGGRKTVYYGIGEHCDCRAENLHLEDGYAVFTACCKGERVPVRLNVMGSHMASNAMAALAVATEYGVALADAVAGLEQFGGYKGRQDIHHVHNMTIIDDSYNASPASMKAGLEVLTSMQPGARKVAVLADMRELGADEGELHREIGAFLAAHPVDEVVLLGELAALIGEGIREKNADISITNCTDIPQVKAWLAANAAAGDCILFKGSNSMKLSEAATWLINKGE